MPSLLSEVESQVKKSPPLKVKSPPHRSKSPPEKQSKGRKSPPGFSLSVTDVSGDVTLPTALKSPPPTGGLTFPAESLKSPPGVTLQVPGGTSKVTLAVPGGDGAPSGGGGTAAPKRKGRVRGMSSVKRFEQEYVSSDFLKDLTDKTTKKGKTKAPMPSVVELFSQVSSLKEEVLVARKNEANMKLRVGDMEQELRARDWQLNDLQRKATMEVIRGEAQMRELIDKMHSDLILQIALLMHDVEPDDSMMQTVDMSEILKIEELNRLLFQETKRNEELQEKIKEMEDAAESVDSPQLSPLTRGESFAMRFDSQEKMQKLQEEIIQKDSEIGRLVAEAMLSKGEISRLETELLQKDSVIRKLSDEKADLSVGSVAVEAEKKKLAAAHKRLADAEMRIVEKESEIAAHATVSRSQERERNAFASGIPVLAFAGKANLSPRHQLGSPSGSLSPRHRKISRA